MEPHKKRRPSKGLGMKDSVFIQWTAETLPPDSPEFQARANRPISERGPNLALYRELHKSNGEPPPPDKQPPSA